MSGNRLAAARRLEFALSLLAAGDAADAAEAADAATEADPSYPEAWFALGEAAEHVAHELPGNRTRVTYLIDSMKCKDPGVLAALSSVRQDDPGMRTNFELAAAFLIPTCPVAKKKTKQSQNSRRWYFSMEAHTPQAQQCSPCTPEKR